MKSKYSESKSIKGALNGDNYEAYPRKLGVGQKDYSNLLIGQYKVIQPIYIDDYDSFMPKQGWLCIDTKNDVYKIFTNLSLSKLYVQFCSDDKFFGMEYVKGDVNSPKLEINNFKNEFLFEVEKEYKNRNDEFSKEQYCKFTTDICKYVNNLNKNLEYFKTISKKMFDDELNRIVNRYHFREIEDLNSIKKCIYLVVLGDYNQFYVGKCDTTLKSRMRKHWTAKVIPSRHLWNGGFEYSRIKFDDFKMFDTTRIFVCQEFDKIIEENQNEANDKRIEVTNTFGLEKFDEMNNLAISERIIINNCKCAFCLSDRTPLIDAPVYKKLEQIYGLTKNDLLVKHYLRLDEKNPWAAQRELFS